MKKILDLYKSLTAGETLLPTSTNFTWWDAVYYPSSSVYDREFARRFGDFRYYDFLEGETDTEAKQNLKADILSVLTINQKKYAEMYRIFTLSDTDMPITYNYDMTETTGAQHTETEYGSKTYTKGQQVNTEGEVSDTHSVSPMNSTTFQNDSQDTRSQQTITDGQRIDTDGQHKDQFDSDEWTLTRKGNIGTQTAADVANSFMKFFDKYKYMEMIFEDIAKELLMIG